MIVCLATRIFEGQARVGPPTSGGAQRGNVRSGVAGQELLTLRPDQSRAIQSRCAASRIRAPDHATASPNYQGSIAILVSPIAAVLGERRAYRSGVSVFEADIADQRSSKLAAGRSFASTVRPFDIVVPAETTVPSGECDLMVAAVAATASRATAANPVIVRCLVIRNLLWSRTPLSCRSPELCEGSIAIRQV